MPSLLESAFRMSRVGQQPHRHLGKGMRSLGKSLAADALMEKKTQIGGLIIVQKPGKNHHSGKSVQNHRTAGVGDFKDHLLPTPCHGQGCQAMLTSMLSSGLKAN